MSSDLQQQLALAEKTARAAGERLRQGVEQLRKVNYEDRNDVKLQADVESESLIRRLLAAESPHPVVGEEQGGDASLTSRYEPYWVVDPLDGTYNYLRGNPSCCVSIGLLRGETPILGVIHDFNTGDTFAGIVAGGFFVNGQPFHPQWAPSRDQAALQTGFPSGMDTSEASLRAFLQTIGGFKKVRMIGSAALALASVAAGRTDVYYEEGIRLWDVAAGLALIQAAGGVVRMKPSKTGKFLAYDVCAAGKAEFLL